VHRSKSGALMSELGQSRRIRTFATLLACPLCLHAMCHKRLWATAASFYRYSITLSARTRRKSGIV